MRMVLTGLRALEHMKDKKPEPKDGFRLLKVQYCAICRTDAKMWNEGHRDLVFPRVPGHEFVAKDESGKRYAVWPGRDCGQCRYCRSGRENLCEDMKITGFHYDGGFGDYVLVPENSLIPVPDTMPSHIACFAEPAGCALHAIGKLRLQEGERMIIYGGGTLGLITALVCRGLGVEPMVIEKNEEKIDKIRPFLETSGIVCQKDTTDSEFDAALNACPDPVAFNLSTVKLGKGGRLSFFSGLRKNQTIETNLINLMHYKETELYGAYGLTRKDMAHALAFIEKNMAACEKLIEAIVWPQNVPDLMVEVLSGKSLKYIIDFTRGDAVSNQSEKYASLAASEISGSESPSDPRVDLRKTIGDKGAFHYVLAHIRPVGNDLRPAAQNKIDNKTKPLGALGKLEDLALQMSLIQNDLNPRIRRKALFVFAADHGIAEEGVSAFPAEVTGQMVNNFLDGGAAINVLCRHHQIDIQVVDMGVNADFDDHPALIKKKVRKGTRNFAIQDAMTAEEAMKAVENGMDVFFKEYTRQNIDIVGVGEMGIANTTSASAIISAVTGISPAEATGRGTGVDDKGMEHKAETIEKALNFHRPDPQNGMEILRKIGGFEIAGIVGAVLAAASKKTAVVLDGLISTAAGLVAYLICPDIGGYLISGHRSVETAQKSALAYMGLEAIIDFNMRLGEGTGAALAMDAVDDACRIMREMASFEEAGVSNKE